MCDLEGLARITHEKLGARPPGALVNAEDAELTDVWIDGDLEYVRDDVFVGVRRNSYPLSPLAGALDEDGRIALGRIRHEPRKDPQQVRDTRARLCRSETHRNEMALAQGLLKRVVELLRRDLLALLEVNGHELLIELDHLIDELSMRGLHGGEVGRRTVRLKETVHHRLPTVRRQIERQALRSKRLAYLRKHVGRLGVPTIDPVDDHEAAESTVARKIHQALTDRIGTARRADHDGDGLHRFEYGERAAEEVRVTGSVEKVNAGRVAIEGQDRRVERMMKGLLLWIEVRERTAACQAPLGPSGACLQQQALREQRLPRAGRSDQRDISDARDRMAHESLPGKRLADDGDGREGTPAGR